MKHKVLAHIGSLMGGMVHNLNTPLMWVMGRSQLIQSRNERVNGSRDLAADEVKELREKNGNDIRSIQEGADKIDQILKSLGYKIQMVSEGFTSIELKEYLEMEVSFLMADMRFKHETKREVSTGLRSFYVKGDYNVLSYTVTGIINSIIKATGKGRTLRIALDNGAIRIGCPELAFSDGVRQEIEDIVSCMEGTADIAIDGTNGFEVSIWLKDT